MKKAKKMGVKRRSFNLSILKNKVIGEIRGSFP